MWILCLRAGFKTEPRSREPRSREPRSKPSALTAASSCIPWVTLSVRSRIWRWLNSKDGRGRRQWQLCRPISGVPIYTCCSLNGILNIDEYRFDVAHADMTSVGVRCGRKKLSADGEIVDVNDVVICISVCEMSCNMADIYIYIASPSDRCTNSRIHPTVLRL